MPPTITKASGTQTSFWRPTRDKAGTKLDNCNLCHRGGSYVNSKGKTVELGSCQWCHQTYGYDGAGEIEDTVNTYGAAYKDAGRNALAIDLIDADDTDGDSYSQCRRDCSQQFPRRCRRLSGD
jgi:hypothetical protein